MQYYSYEEIMEKINHASVFGSMPGVEISRILLEALDHPEQGIPFVHVAGTNGKGSVCAFLTQILMECGLKVGTFTSPHLIHFEERITVNNVQIGKKDVERLGNRLLELNLDVNPTMFDYCMAMALLYFKEQQCDILVMETGLGGRLDSTNAVGVPEVSVITKIGFDHMAILGNTLAQIAGEKAGILKPGTYLVMERQEPEAAEVLHRAIREVGTAAQPQADARPRTGEANADREQQSKKASQDCLQLSYTEVSEADLAWVKTRKLGLLGTHQWENAAAAALAAKYLIQNRFPAWDKKKIERVITEGLGKTRWPGRMEVLSEEPFFLVDGAHNGHGVKALFDSLTYLYPGERFHFIMGVMADKDYEQMVECLLPLAKRFGTVTPENHRALQAKSLAAFIEQFHIPVDTYESVTDVVTDILQNQPHNDKIVAFGSLYFIGELEAVWQQKK
jgi:dihydrofolate synthase/folylpolyglutamate synthase